MLFLQSRLKQLLHGVPEELQDIFGVSNRDDFYRLELAYARLRKWEATRRDVICIQKKYDLPFAPNDTLLHTRALVRLKARKDALRKKFNNNEDNET